MPASEALKRAVRKYEKENIRQIKFNLSLKYDLDVIEKLDSVQNKQGYIKSLIRADIARANSGKKEEEKDMSIYDFVQDLFNSCPVTPEKMDLDTARIDLANFASEGWEMPQDITPEEYMTVWNELVSRQENDEE